MRMTLDNLMETQPIRDSSGEVVENNIGDPVIEKDPQFPLYWLGISMSLGPISSCTHMIS